MSELRNDVFCPDCHLELEFDFLGRNRKHNLQCPCCKLNFTLKEIEIENKETCYELEAEDYVQQ